MEGKKYHWCTNHQAWTLHSPEQCRGKSTKNKVVEEEDHTQPDNYDEAMAAVMQAIESDSDSESQE